MADAKNLLLRSNLKQLRLPVMGAEFEKLAREAAAANESYEQFLLRLTELEVAARSSNAVQARIRLAGFPVSKDFDTFDFSAVPARFTTAATLVTRLEAAQKQYQLDKVLTQMDKADLLICDELGYLSFSRSGAELLFQLLADRYERRSLLLTSNLAFGEWGTVFQGERMTAALLDRLTHRCAIFEMNGESFRFRESMKGKKSKKGEASQPEKT